MPNVFPDTAPFTSEFLQCNNYWIFALAREGADRGRLFYRPNTEISGVSGAWKLYGKTGRPVDRFRNVPDKPLERLDMDNDVLLAVAEGGLVYRLLDTFESDPDKFSWRKSWGWPFDEGPQFRIRRGYEELCFSSSKEWSTMWTSDLDGNRHHRFIDHMYCLSSRDTLIHHNDPWTPGDWAYAFTSPESGRLLPSRGDIPGYTSGINASGGVLGFIAPNGVWTIEYDFDIAGGNPLAEYVPHSLPPYEGIAPIVRFEKGAKPIRLPSAPWQSHGELPGPCTAHIQLSPQWDSDGKIVPGPQSRVMRILGLDRFPDSAGSDAPVPGFWEKLLDETAWHFVPWSGVPATAIARNLINGTPTHYGPVLVSDWETSPLADGSRVTLTGFGPHSNFFEPARFTLEKDGNTVAAQFITHVQMRTSRAGRALARLRGRRKPAWLGVFIVFPEDEVIPASDAALGAELRMLCRAKPEGRYSHLLLRVGKRRLELIKPVVTLNADIANWINAILGKRVARFRRITKDT